MDRLPLRSLRVLTEELNFPQWKPTGPFEGFGPFRLFGKLEPTRREFDLPDDRLLARAAVRNHCGQTPGVYGMIDASGELIYVGKAKSLSNRLLSYLAKTPADPKARRIIQRAKRITFEPAPHEFVALLRELELIRRFRPWFNRQGKPRRDRMAYLCVGRGPAPHAYLAKTPPLKAMAVFGPLRWNRRLTRAVRQLNDRFQLRDCPSCVSMRFADQLELFEQTRDAECARHDFGACLGPCAGACTTDQYANRSRALCDFLAGADNTPAELLERQMAAAAGGQRFEQAAILRDALRDLTFVRDRLTRLRHVRGAYSFVYPLPGYRGRETWYMVRGGDVIQAAVAPRSQRERRRRADTLETIYQSVAAREDADTLQLVSLWFRRHPEELQRTISPDDARRMCS
jgi:excinuclease ABC subunit C